MYNEDDVRLAFSEVQDLEYYSKGGQKVVFKGIRDGIDVVVKIMPGRPSPRFQREVAAVQALRSDYVPKLHEFSIRQIRGINVPYLIEDFVTGEPYSKILERTPQQPIASVLRLGEQLLTACVAFEQAHLVHRDIKPDNLIVGADQKLWVIDFGIVRFIDEDSLTRTDAFIGPCTPGYGSPEQVQNLKDLISIRSDLFSVGIVMYESLVGENPFLAGSRSPGESMARVRLMELPRVTSSADPQGLLGDLIASLSARRVSSRPQTAHEALEWLQEVKTHLA